MPIAGPSVASVLSRLFFTLLEAQTTQHRFTPNGLERDSSFGAAFGTGDSRV
jgi:hypothetical protein